MMINSFLLLVSTILICVVGKSQEPSYVQSMLGVYKTKSVKVRSYVGGSETGDTVYNVLLKIARSKENDSIVEITYGNSTDTSQIYHYREDSTFLGTKGSGKFHVDDSIRISRNIAARYFEHYYGRKIKGNNITENTLAAVTVYPNPAKETVYISGAQGGAFTASVYTLNGQVQRVTQQSNTLKVGTLAPGIYLLVLEKGMHRKVLRFVKE